MKFEDVLVSVILSAYNCEEYIVESLNSIINQTHKNLEIIIVDDCSTDNTLEKIKSIKDDRIHIIANSENKKLAYNLNYAISLSKGKYIARMDCDDISCNKRIEKQVMFMENNPRVDIVGTNVKTFGDYTIKLKYPQTHEQIKSKLFYENALCHPSVMFRKSSINFCYDAKVSAGQDYELWSRLIMSHNFYNIQEYLFKYRIHSKQTRNTNSTKQKEGAMLAKIRMNNYLLFDSTTKKRDEQLLKEAIEGNNLNIVSDYLKKTFEENRVKKVFEIKSFQKEGLNWYYKRKVEISKNVSKINNTANIMYFDKLLPLKKKLYFFLNIRKDERRLK